MIAKKQGIYVLRYMRALMTQTGQLDDKVILLCTKVALAEDSQRDGKPVRFTTDFLADALRVGRRRLIELRNDAVEAGWAKYRQGRKDHPGEYATALPQWCREPECAEPAALCEVECAESAELCEPQCAESAELCEPQCAESAELCEPQCAESATESAPESELCEVECAEPATESAPQKTLYPNPKKESARAPKKPKAKAAPKYPEPFERFWGVYPPRNDRKLDKVGAYKGWIKLTPEDQALILIAATNYAGRTPDKTGFLEAPRDAIRFLKDDWWRGWTAPATVEPSAPNGPPKAVYFKKRELQPGEDIDR